jgi:peptidoglycan hydrolase-like protein with peptidoglycan-binding domain
MGYTLAYDCCSVNLGFAPAAQRAGYATGSEGIQWTAVQFANNPGVVVIDQDPSATDHTADVLDVESGAATIADIPGWVRDALAAYEAGARPGQRKPAIYVSQANLTAAANILVANKLVAYLWLADPDLTIAEAEAKLAPNQTGTMPMIGVQYAWGTRYDTDVFESSWLALQSGKAGDTVAQGSSGPAVLALQKALTAAGHKTAADTLFGAGTLAMVKAFQTAKKLTVDGIAGPDTWKALTAAPAPTPAPTPPKPAPTPAPTPVAPKIAGPTGVKLDPTKYPLTWNPVVFGGKALTQYRVLVTNAAGQTVSNGVVTGNSATLTNLVAGQKYKVSISADPPTGYTTTVTTVTIP